MQRQLPFKSVADRPSVLLPKLRRAIRRVPELRRASRQGFLDINPRKASIEQWMLEGIWIGFCAMTKQPCVMLIRDLGRASRVHVEPWGRPPEVLHTKEVLWADSDSDGALVVVRKRYAASYARRLSQQLRRDAASANLVGDAGQHVIR